MPLRNGLPENENSLECEGIHLLFRYALIGYLACYPAPFVHDFTHYTNLSIVRALGSPRGVEA